MVLILLLLKPIFKILHTCNIFLLRYLRNLLDFSHTKYKAFTYNNIQYKTYWHLNLILFTSKPYCTYVEFSCFFSHNSLVLETSILLPPASLPLWSKPANVQPYYKNFSQNLSAAKSSSLPHRSSRHSPSRF